LKAINVGIIGVSGYTGLELLKMILTHPLFTLNYCANTEGETTISVIHPALAGCATWRSKKSILTVPPRHAN
jgi:N-acetyl-gamma-glutamyl-phosphate reductase